MAKERTLPSSPYGPGVNGWENGSIEAFLDSAIAWAADTRGDAEQAGNNPWRRCAEILYAGKAYE